MRNIQHVCAVAVLTLILAFSTLAGEIQAPGVTAAAGVIQPPGVSTAGEIQLPGATADPLTEMALGFLLNLSSLL
ncbi:MAG TPA: hypothetical protein VE732_00555 [Nitrososphaera sp.]|nr:hypothetical protein [Nitrososphaera sp.]